MPRLRMPTGQQVIYDELVDSADGARLLNLRQIARFWGKDDRAARKWVREKQLPTFPLNGVQHYAARDVAKAIWESEG
ncbi:MAG: hypothetical protein K5919_05105 [Clostridiales bacterium]|nr:hypothetical protein [Clostridiales bacterium]